MMKLLASTMLAAGLCAFAGSARAAGCGEITIAEMNWASAGVTAHLDKFILEKGYGCTATLVAGDIVPTFASMNEKGQPDMAPEMWVSSLRVPLAKAVEEGRLIQAAKILNEGGVEGWWIPKFLADAHPDIRTVQDALKYPDLFPAPRDAAKAAIYNCPSGWNCHVSTANLYRALGAEGLGFELVDPGSAAGLDESIANAFEQKIGWLGYYWAPTSILGKYDMIRLSFNTEHDKAQWDTCTTVPDCPDPKVNSYPTSDVYTLVTKAFSEKAGVAMDYVKNRNWDNSTVNKILAWMETNKATNEQAARYFLETYPDIWTKWVAPDVAERIRAAL